MHPTSPEEHQDEPKTYRKTVPGTIRLYLKGILLGLPLGFPPDFEIRWTRGQVNMHTREGWKEETIVSREGGEIVLWNHKTGHSVLKFPVTKVKLMEVYTKVKDVDLLQLKLEHFFYNSDAPLSESLSIIAWNQFSGTHFGTGTTLPAEGRKVVYGLIDLVSALHSYEVHEGKLVMNS